MQDRVELQYYDGLADQETPILLTVRPDRPPAPAALVSPIEHCIRTKYVVSCRLCSASAVLLPQVAGSRRGLERFRAATMIHNRTVCLYFLI